MCSTRYRFGAYSLPLNRTSTHPEPQQDQTETGTQVVEGKPFVTGVLDDSSQSERAQEREKGAEVFATQIADDVRTRN